MEIIVGFGLVIVALGYIACLSARRNQGSARGATVNEPQYHLTCKVCDELFWSTDAFAKKCSHCSDDVVFTMIDKLYPATWDPKGADECGILYCHGIDYAFGIDPDETEDWWGPQLAEAINDAHDLRAEVERLREEAADALALVREYFDEGVVFFDLDTIPEMNRRAEDWLARARALSGEMGSRA